MILNMSIPEFLLTLATGGSLLGIITICIGIYILVSKIVGKDVRDLANQTSKMAQKGLTDDVSGLVGNASTLLNALNDLIRTSSGVGVFLVFLGLLLIGGAYFLVTRI